MIGFLVALLLSLWLAFVASLVHLWRLSARVELLESWGHPTVTTAAAQDRAAQAQQIVDQLAAVQSRRSRK